MPRGLRASPPRRRPTRRASTPRRARSGSLRRAAAARSSSSRGSSPIASSAAAVGSVAQKPSPKSTRPPGVTHSPEPVERVVGAAEGVRRADADDDVGEVDERRRVGLDELDPPVQPALRRERGRPGRAPPSRCRPRCRSSPGGRRGSGAGARPSRSRGRARGGRARSGAPPRARSRAPRRAAR